LPDPRSAAQVTAEDVQQVAEALHSKLTTGMSAMMVGRSGSSEQFIAAQFKNANMRGSNLEPKLIEAALTKIIDDLDQFPKLEEIKCTLSYHHDGSMMAPKGVRTFRIAGRE